MRSVMILYCAGTGDTYCGLYGVMVAVTTAHRVVNPIDIEYPFDIEWNGFFDDSEITS